MSRLLSCFVAVLLGVGLVASAWGAGPPDRAKVVERVRAELAKILNKEPAKLPVDKPVLELGADELDVVEWIMAVEEAFDIEIPDTKVADPKTNKVRKDFSIASMVVIVMEAKPRAGGKKS